MISPEMNFEVLLVGLGVLGLITGIHEFGHYLMARIVKVGVESFSIGFGKEIWSKKDSRGTIWKISAIPLGGYISPKNSSNETIIGTEFNKAGFFRGTLIALGGPLFNFILAFFCFAYINLFFGLEKSSLYLADVTPGSPAHQVGLKINDKIIEINRVKLTNIREIPPSAENPEIKILRNGFILDFKLKKSKREFYGMRFIKIYRRVGFFDAIKIAFLNVHYNILKFFTSIFDSILSLKIVGPIGIIREAGNAHKNGLVDFLLFIAAFSIGIGAFNLLPIPILDGGRVMMFGLEAIIRRPVPTWFESILNYASIGFVAGIFLLTLFIDLKGFL